jgi:hypothetical protein
VGILRIRERSGGDPRKLSLFLKTLRNLEVNRMNCFVL